MTHRFSRLAVVALFAAAPAFAQNTTNQQPVQREAAPAIVADTAHVAATASRTVVADPVAVRRSAVATTSVSSEMFAQRRNVGQAQAMMIVGGAALVTGAIIGDDVGTIFMVGGAVIGLYGLYEFLK